MDNFIWHKQSEDDISDAITDWKYHSFACILNNGKLVEFNGCWDDDYLGSANLHINDPDFIYDVNEIKLWIEIPIKL